MEVALIIFALLSLSVLGALCLLVLECQNRRTRRWSRIWSQLDRTPRSSPPPPPVPTGQGVMLHEVSAAD